MGDDVAEVLLLDVGVELTEVLTEALTDPVAVELALLLDVRLAEGDAEFEDVLDPDPEGDGEAVEDGVDVSLHHG